MEGNASTLSYVPMILTLLSMLSMKMSTNDNFLKPFKHTQKRVMSAKKKLVFAFNSDMYQMSIGNDTKIRL